MPAFSWPSRYGVVEQSFHWLTLLLVVAAYLLSVGGSEARLYSDALDFQRRMHETAGVTVLGVTLLRLVWRTIDNQPKSPPMPLWMEISGQLMHWTLYLLLLAVPLTAIIGVWLAGHPLTLVSANNIGPWLAPAHDLGATIIEIHTWAGDAILWLVGLHAGAALFHHFILRDTVLTSMLPASFVRPRSPGDSPVKR